jgi:predicted metalloendopeptidase
MDSAGIEKQGLQPLRPDLQKMKTLQISKIFFAYVQNWKKGVDVLMGGGIYQDEK